MDSMPYEQAVILLGKKTLLILEITSEFASLLWYHLKQKTVLFIPQQILCVMEIDFCYNVLNTNALIILSTPTCPTKQIPNRDKAVTYVIL